MIQRQSLNTPLPHLKYSLTSFTAMSGRYAQHTQHIKQLTNSTHLSNQEAEVSCWLINTDCIFRKEHIPMDAWQVTMNHVRRAIDRSALYFCGFPTLQHIKHKVNYGMDVIAVCRLYV